MKKKIIGLAFTIAVVSALSTAAYASTYVNNEDVTSSVFTSSSNGYTLFPVRYLGEKLGCDVYWNPDDKCITVSKDDIHRDFYNGSAAVYDWEGNSYNLVTAPKLVDGNTMVPAEFYRDQFGISVIWDDVTSSLFINSENTYNWLVDTAEYKDAKKRKEVNYADYVGSYTCTPTGESRPLIGLDINEANGDYIVANAYRLRGKGYEYTIGKANMTSAYTAETYGSFGLEGRTVSKKYKFSLRGSYIIMNIYDTSGNLEDSYTFYKN